jgi:hypothetical protein
MVDFDIGVEESFWHGEYVTASTIVIEENFDRFSLEVSHAGKKSAMQLGMQKSAMKEQSRFNKYEEYTREMDFSLIEAFMMQMTERLIHQFEGYTREVGCLLKEVFMMHMEERLIYLCKRYAGQEKVIMVEFYVMKMENRLTVKDNDMVIVNKM